MANLILELVPKIEFLLGGSGQELNLGKHCQNNLSLVSVFYQTYRPHVTNLMVCQQG